MRAFELKHLEEGFDGESKEQFVEIFSKFLPLAVKVIGLKRLPKFEFLADIEYSEQPTFGMYANDEHKMYVALANRHPNDILRTVAHELTHYKQDSEHKLNDKSGTTGSPEENEANAVAGIVMRHFNKMYPEYLRVKPVINELLENFTNYQGVRPPKNVPGTNLFPGQDIVGQRVYHCTNRLEAIKKSGGLKPRRDATGEREYGRLSTDEHPFIPVIGIWFSVGKPDWPGKHCVSFVIEPTDQVYVAYANTKGLKPNVVLNPIALDRLTVEGQQDVAENFADGRNPQDKGDAKRHGVNTKASVSSLRKTAKQGGRKGQLAHWMANMKSGREK